MYSITQHSWIETIPWSLQTMIKPSPKLGQYAYTLKTEEKNMACILEVKILTCIVESTK